MAQKIADGVDRRILKELSANARLTNNELAERVGLSASACLRRLRRLEETGIIRGYSVLVDPALEGWTMTAIASIRLSRQHDDEIRMFEDAVRSWDEVIECQLVTGSRDYILTVMSAGLESYERFIKDKIAKLNCRRYDRNQFRDEHDQIPQIRRWTMISPQRPIARGSGSL